MKNREQQRGPLMICMMTTLNFRNKSVGEKLIESGRIVRCTTGNSNFPNPEPSLSSVFESIVALQIAESNMNGSRQATITRDARLEELTFKMQKLRSYVESESGRNKEKIASSGFGVRKTASKVGLLEFPSFFVALSTPVYGQIILKWKAVKKRTNYVIQYTTNPVSMEGVISVSTTKLSYVLNNLSDTNYYFRIATVSTAGNGGYSPWISCRPR